MASENPEEEKLAKGVGDLLARLRRAPASSTPEEAPPKKLKTAAAEETAASSSAAFAQPAPLTEFGFELPAHCVEFIVQCFAPEKGDTVRPVAEFYVGTLRSQASKADSLGSLFRKKVINARLLASSSGRKAWLCANEHNRARRFVPAPAVVWSSKKT